MPSLAVMILSGNCTYDGLTTIQAGTLQVGNGGTSGWITTPVENRAELRFNRSDPVIFDQPISGNGSLTKLGTGTLTLRGNHIDYDYLGLHQMAVVIPEPVAGLALAVGCGLYALGRRRRR